MKILLSTLLVCAAAFAAEPVPAAKSADANKTAPCCRVTPAPGKPTDKSLYLLESQWTSDRGATVPLRVLQGRPQVVAMFFTNCEYACPIIVNDMKKLQALLPPGARAQTDFLLVSMDPKRDTREALASFREKKELPLESWTLLRGREDDVRELAALLGVNYAPDSRGQFAHSNILTVLNAQGEICYQQPGLQAAPEGLIRALEKAVAEAKP
jgi:protein SCO1